MDKLASIRAFTKVVQHNSFAARLALVREQISSIEKTRAEQLERAPDTGPHAMVRLLARVIGIGIETADMLVREILSRNLRDRRALARYAGLTGSPDESGFDERGWETERCRLAQATAPILNSTLASFTAVHKISTRSEVLRT